MLVNLMQIVIRLFAVALLASGCAAPSPYHDDDEGIEINEYWMRCAANFTVTHRNKCAPYCGQQHYAALVNEVAESCGGSDVQPSGGYLLSKIWQEAARRGN